jgi:predicted benzoate:H+ symporter BenE
VKDVSINGFLVKQLPTSLKSALNAKVLIGMCQEGMKRRNKRGKRIK